MSSLFNMPAEFVFPPFSLPSLSLSFFLKRIFRNFLFSSYSYFSCRSEISSQMFFEWWKLMMPVITILKLTIGFSLFFLSNFFLSLSHPSPSLPPSSDDLLDPLIEFLGEIHLGAGADGKKKVVELKPPPKRFVGPPIVGWLTGIGLEKYQNEFIGWGYTGLLIFVLMIF